MTKAETNPNAESQIAMATVRQPFRICDLSFVRHSSFVIRH
jgi:hypothetical protein